MLNIIYKKTNELIPYVNNSRVHSESQIQQIASSLKEFGFTNPILIDADNQIIAGHGRLKAAQLLNLEEVPTILLAEMTDAQKKAYVIADNKLALNANWDEELLKLELGDLNTELTPLTGFTPDEIDLLINGWSSDIEQIDDIEAKDTVDKKKILIKVPRDDYQEVWEAVTNALDNLGIDDIEIS